MNIMLLPLFTLRVKDVFSNLRVQLLITLIWLVKTTAIFWNCIRCIVMFSRQTYFVISNFLVARKLWAETCTSDSLFEQRIYIVSTLVRTESVF